MQYKQSRLLIDLHAEVTTDTQPSSSVLLVFLFSFLFPNSLPAAACWMLLLCCVSVSVFGLFVDLYGSAVTFFTGSNCQVGVPSLRGGLRSGRAACQSASHAAAQGRSQCDAEVMEDDSRADRLSEPGLYS